MIEKLKSVKGIGYLTIALAAGILLIIMSSLGGESKAAESGAAVCEEQKLEERIAAMLGKLEGISSASVMVTLESYDDDATPIIKGIAVICPEGNDASVKLRIVKLLDALFGLSTGQIFVGAE